MTNSRRKGAEGEREWATLLKEFGFDARRGQQHRGGNDSPDVICEELDWLHCEVKRRQSINLHVAMHKAADEAGEKTPYIAHRKNGEPWLVTMDGLDWLQMMKDREALD